MTFKKVFLIIYQYIHLVTILFEIGYMAKVKTSFFCQNCGSQYTKWQGQCTACKQWNTIVEEVIQKPEKKDWNLATITTAKRVSKPLKIKDIDGTQDDRLNIQDLEFNRVLGGGMVPGSLTLLGGEPGIGKSTLLLQIALKLPYKTLYVSGEESQKQIKMRAERINPHSDHCFILTETKTQNIFKQIESLEPDIVIIAIKPQMFLEVLTFFSQYFFLLQSI